MTLPKQIMPLGVSMALEWGKSLLEEFSHSSFEIKKAHGLVKLCAAMIMRAAFMIPKSDLDTASRMLQTLVRYVPDAKSAGVLEKVVQDIYALGLLANDDSIKVFLSVLSMKVN
jgi:hypothetical protein